MKILLVDDHAIVRKGLLNIIEDISDVESIDECETGEAALEAVNSENYDYVILDIGLSDMNGLEVLRKIKANHNQLPVLILSMHHEEHYAMKAFEYGASGYVTKNSAPEELETAIRKISKGDRFVSSAIAPLLIDYISGKQSLLPHQNLSEREMEILLLLASGQSVSKIAEKLYISVKTVSTYRSRLLKKMDMNSNADIVKYAIKHGLTE